jgi:protein tyrosine phosphatase
MKTNYCIKILYILAIIINLQYGYSVETKSDDYIVTHLRQEFKNLCNVVIQLEDSIVNYTSYKIHSEFKQQVENKTQPAEIKLFLTKADTESKFFYPPTYSKIFGLFYMPEGVSASKKHIYNASRIPITSGYCVAAEGPNDETFESFLALLGELEARVSISLVSKREFLVSENKRISSSLATNEGGYFINEIKSDTDPNITIRDSHSVKLIDCFASDEAFLEYELLLINNKYHLRIYHTNWIDNESSSLSKLIKIILFIKKVKQLDAFKDTICSPAAVVNCNAGAGRAGTFISIWNLTDNYLNNREIPDVAEFIVNSRNYRSYFVYNGKQYGMIKYLSQNLSEYLDK